MTSIKMQKDMRRMKRVFKKVKKERGIRLLRERKRLLMRKISDARRLKKKKKNDLCFQIKRIHCLSSFLKKATRKQKFRSQRGTWDLIE